MHYRNSMEARDNVLGVYITIFREESQTSLKIFKQLFQSAYVQVEMDGCQLSITSYDLTQNGKVCWLLNEFEHVLGLL